MHHLYKILTKFNPYADPRRRRRRPLSAWKAPGAGHLGALLGIFDYFNNISNM